MLVPSVGARRGANALAQRSGIEPVKVIGLRRKIAEKMAEAKRRIPHFAYVEESDLTELEDLRAHLNATKRTDQPKLTLLPFLMRALVLALPDFPQINARYDDEQGVVFRHEAIDIGIATQTENGLIVPVVRHAEARDVWDCAAEVLRLAAAVRANTATKEELSGSTITITSLGALGGIVTTPVINHPEVAIIGVNKLVERPMVKNGQIVVRKMMNLSSSFDHRVVDGYDAAAFIQRVKGMLEHPAALFIER
jgi:2-oxoisovalerate dehydrogenase E2 component (dihydrolipoyl transacylase)